MWTAVIAIMAMVLVLAVVVFMVRSAVTSSGTARKAAFANIDTEVRSNVLIGISEAQLVARYGPGARIDRERLVFMTGRKLGNPLHGPRQTEQLVVRLNPGGLVMEAKLGASGVPN